MSVADALASLDAFSAFPRSEVEMIASCMRELVLQPGETVIEQGERARAMYVVITGELTVERRAVGSGSRLTLSSRGPGTLFGMLSLIDGNPRMSSCRATRTTRIAELPADDFARLMTANTPIGTRFQHAIATALIRELRVTNQRVADIAALPEVDADTLLTALSQFD